MNTSSCSTLQSQSCAQKQMINRELVEIFRKFGRGLDKLAQIAKVVEEMKEQHSHALRLLDEAIEPPLNLPSSIMDDPYRLQPANQSSQIARGRAESRGIRSRQEIDRLSSGSGLQQESRVSVQIQRRQNRRFNYNIDHPPIFRPSQGQSAFSNSTIRSSEIIMSQEHVRMTTTCLIGMLRRVTSLLEIQNQRLNYDEAQEYFRLIDEARNHSSQEELRLLEHLRGKIAYLNRRRDRFRN